MAFLEYEDRILLMKRGMHKSIGPGAWSGIAGHIQGVEINHPYDACFREINEEAGLSRQNIDELALKYIIYNKLDEETIVNHIFFGYINTDKVVANDEGDLFWIPKEEVAEKMYVPAVRLACEHYFSTPSDNILISVAKKEEPYILWHPL